jgi:general secretion pathway protein N
MRPLAIHFATFCALAATAAAGPLDDPGRPAPGVEEAAAPSTEGASAAAGLVESTPAPDPAARLRAGNPLWTIPLNALSATRDRPLFSASRRPPAVATVIVPPPPPKVEVLAPSPPERPLLTLVGTIVSRKASVAMLQGSNAETVSRLRVGQENDGWRVQGISLRSIVVEKGTASVELGLPRPDGTPAQ